MKKYTLLLLFVTVKTTCLLAQKVPLAVLEKGKKIYSDNCLVCHQEDGSGVPGMNPPLIKTKWVLGDKAQLITIVLKGLSKPIEIEGETYQNPMPAQTHLTNEQIAQVLTYIRSGFGNKASAVTVAEVNKLRPPAK